VSGRSRHVVRERELVAELLAGVREDDAQLRAIDDPRLRCIVAAFVALRRLGHAATDEELTLVAQLLMQLSPAMYDVGLDEVLREVEALRREAPARERAAAGTGATDPAEWTVVCAAEGCTWRGDPADFALSATPIVACPNGHVGQLRWVPAVPDTSGAGGER
jgi:hypothetical protein